MLLRFSFGCQSRLWTWRRSGTKRERKRESNGWMLCIHRIIYLCIHVLYYIIIVYSSATVQTMQLIVMSGFVYAPGQFDSLWPEQVVGRLSFFSLRFFFFFFLLPAVWARFASSALSSHSHTHTHTHTHARTRCIRF